MESIVLQCLAENYRIHGSVLRLPGENLNFLVTNEQGKRFVLKIVDDDMPEAVVQMENAVVEHASKANLPFLLPRIIPNRLGQIETRISIPGNSFDRARLISFVDGKQLDSLSDISEKMARNVGIMMAEFDQAMENFTYPAAHRTHRWNLADAGRHRAKTELFQDPEKREIVRRAFEYWDTSARSLLDSLPHQVIHGDAHCENILIRDDRIVGLVDFGDVVYNPRACELGVCLPYMMARDEQPLRIASAVVEGYHSRIPLSAAERSVLMPLACGRLAVTLCVSEMRRSIDPDNPNWFDGHDDNYRLLKYLFESGSAGSTNPFL